MKPLLLLGLAALLSAPAGLTLTASVSPKVVSEDGSILVKCVVRPATERKLGRLTIEVEHYTSSSMDLEGEEGRNQFTVERPFHRIPCVSEAVFCRLERSDGVLLSKAPLIVSGCSDPTNPLLGPVPDAGR